MALAHTNFNESSANVDPLIAYSHHQPTSNLQLICSIYASEGELRRTQASLTERCVLLNLGKGLEPFVCLMWTNIVDKLWWKLQLQHRRD